MRARLYRQMAVLAWEHPGLSQLNSCILGIVLFSILAAVLQSEPVIRQALPGLFDGLTTVFAIAFTVEYAARIWAMGENVAYAGFAGRLRYARTIASLFDLVATLALWLDLLIGFGGVYGVLLRLARALRVITLMRRSAVATAIRLLRDALKSRILELSMSFGLAGIVLLISATLLFAVEGTMQPDTFGSIPRAMWWAMATLTTVGYGDVYPVTAWGKLLASMVAITSIAIVAMPTGIMAAAFSDAFQDLRDPKKA